MFPYISKPDLAARAESFLAEHNPDRKIPVPIESIVESQFKMDIVPVPGLRNFDVDAYLSQDQQEIWVDEYVYENRENRYRFSLAHELAHRILHGELWKNFTFDDVEGWVHGIKNLIGNKEYGLLEWQANFLAGIVLAPTVELGEVFDETRERWTRAEIAVLDDAARDIIEGYIARHFVVSTAVVHRRLEHERLWEDERT